MIPVNAAEEEPTWKPTGSRQNSVVMLPTSFLHSWMGNTIVTSIFLMTKYKASRFDSKDQRGAREASGIPVAMSPQGT